MFFEAKTKGTSEESYADWQAIVAKECETDASRNFSFKASKRIFRIEHARGDFEKAKATFEKLVSFIPGAEANAVRKAFLNRKQAKNLLHVLCPKLNLVPYMRKRGAVEKSDAEMPFILSLHEILLKAVESKRSTYEGCPVSQRIFVTITPQVPRRVEGVLPAPCKTPPLPRPSRFVHTALPLPPSKLNPDTLLLLPNAAC